MLLSKSAQFFAMPPHYTIIIIIMYLQLLLQLHSMHPPHTRAEIRLVMYVFEHLGMVFALIL